MATFVTTVTSDSNRKGVAFANNTGTISAGSTLDIVNDFTLSYAVKQLNNDSAHWCKGEPEDPSIASGMIYTESKGKKLRTVLFDVNGTNVLSIITDNRVLASNKSKVIQIRYKQSTDLLEVFIDGVQVTYTIETSELYYHANVSDLTGINTNASNMTFGSASGKTDFDGILYGAVFDLEYLNNTDLNTVYNTLKDVVTSIESYQQVVFVSNRDGLNKIYQMSEDGNDAIVLNGAFTNPDKLHYNLNSSKILLSHTNSTYSNIGLISDTGAIINSDAIAYTTDHRYVPSFQLNDDTVILFDSSSNNDIVSSNDGVTTTVVVDNVGTYYNTYPFATIDKIYYLEQKRRIIRGSYPTYSYEAILYTGVSIGDLDNLVISKDLTKIGFSQFISGNWQVCVMNIDGSGYQQITSDANDNKMSDFNSDCTKVLFTKALGGVEQIHICNIDGTNQVNLSNNAYNEKSPIFKPVV